MRKNLLLVSALFLSGLASAQSPEITSWMLNNTGHKADYEYYAGNPLNGSTYVQLNDSSDIKSVCYNSTDVYVKANGLANYTMGPFMMNPNVPASQNYTFKITRTPAEETGTKSTVPIVGAIGVAVNGVVLYGYGDARSYSSAQNSNVGSGDGNWFSDAWVSEGETMDVSGSGHPDSRGVYHYHATPYTLYDETGSTHSPIIAYALDGYPIYGPFGYAKPRDPSSPIVRMYSGYELRNITTRDILPDGTTSIPAGPDVSPSFPLGTYIEDYEFTGNGKLDQYNGRFCVTPEYPAGTYAYFITTDNAGSPAFPYILSEEYYGVVSTQDLNQAGNSTTPSGLTCYDGVITSVDAEISVILNVYPNPVTNRVTVETEQKIERLSLISPEGVTLETWTPMSNKKEINTERYPSGLYFLQISTGYDITTKSLQIIK